MKLALTCAVAFSIVTGAGTYAYLDASHLDDAAATVRTLDGRAGNGRAGNGGEPAHAERDGSSTVPDPISQSASR